MPACVHSWRLLKSVCSSVVSTSFTSFEEYWGHIEHFSKSNNASALTFFPLKSGGHAKTESHCPRKLTPENITGLLSSSLWPGCWCRSPCFRAVLPQWSAGASCSSRHLGCSAWRATRSCWPPWRLDPLSRSRESSPQCRRCCAFQDSARYKTSQYIRRVTGAAMSDLLSRWPSRGTQNFALDARHSSQIRHKS